MTGDFQLQKFNDLVSNFYKIKKRVLQRRPISGQPEKINEYITLLIENYNKILRYTEPHYKTFNTSLLTTIENRIIHCRELLAKCFDKLRCQIRIPFGLNLFELVLSEVMIASSSETDISGKSEEDKERIVEIKNTVDTPEELVEIIENVEMASIEEKTKFIAMCSNIIRENYSGDPLTLSSFIDKIDLLQELVSEKLGKCFIAFKSLN